MPHKTEYGAEAVRLVSRLLDDPETRIYQAWCLMGESEREEALQTIANVIEETVDAQVRAAVMRIANQV